jgi:hypothetical protein
MTHDPSRSSQRGSRPRRLLEVTRGERLSRVSSEWFSRPADERYLSLSKLFAAAAGPIAAELGW